MSDGWIDFCKSEGTAIDVRELRAEAARLRARVRFYELGWDDQHKQLQAEIERLRALLKRAAPYIDYCTGGSDAAKAVLREIDAMAAVRDGE